MLRIRMEIIKTIINPKKGHMILATARKHDFQNRFSGWNTGQWHCH